MWSHCALASHFVFIAHVTSPAEGYSIALANRTSLHLADHIFCLPLLPLPTGPASRPDPAALSASGSTGGAITVSWVCPLFPNPDSLLVIWLHVWLFFHSHSFAGTPAACPFSIVLIGPCCPCAAPPLACRCSPPTWVELPLRASSSSVSLTLEMRLGWFHAPCLLLCVCMGSPSAE